MSSNNNNYYSPASLLGILQHKQDAFNLISGFVGNPFDFRRLGQTCHSLNKHFALDNDDVWKLSLGYTDPSDDSAKLDCGDYSEDDRLPRMWEKAMVKAVSERAYSEQQKEDNIIWDEINDFISLAWSAFDACTDNPDSRLGGAAVTLRDDTGFALSALVEANVVEYISHANAMAISRGGTNDTFPCMTLNDIFGARQISSGVAFEGSTVSTIKMSTIESVRDYGAISDKIVLRLAHRAGVIQLTNEAIHYVKKMIVWLLWALPDVMAKTEACFESPKSLQHPANIHMNKFPPKLEATSKQWMPTPAMLTLAAKAMKLPISTVYDSEKRVNTNDLFQVYYKRLTSQEKQEYKLSADFRYDAFEDYDFEEWGSESEEESDSDDGDDDESMVEVVDEEARRWFGFCPAEQPDDDDGDDVSMSSVETEGESFL